MTFGGPIFAGVALRGRGAEQCAACEQRHEPA